MIVQKPSKAPKDKTKSKRSSSSTLSLPHRHGPRREISTPSLRRRPPIDNDHNGYGFTDDSNLGTATVVPAVADYGPLQQTWIDEDGERFHFRGLAAVPTALGGPREAVYYLPVTDSRLRASPYINSEALVSMQTHTIQEWAPRRNPTREKINVRIPTIMVG